MRRFEACVTFRSPEGVQREETFPVVVEDYDTAKSTALSYVLQISSCASSVPSPPAARRIVLYL